jgi:hypothetical protein
MVEVDDIANIGYGALIEDEAFVGFTGEDPTKDGRYKHQCCEEELGCRHGGL